MRFTFLATIISWEPLQRGEQRVGCATHTLAYALTITCYFKEDMTDSFLSCIGAGLTSVPTITNNLTRVNLHANCVRSIGSSFANATNLQELDLSSNQLRSTIGFSPLISVTCLNIACNKVMHPYVTFISQIVCIEGLGALTRLQKLNLSYNRINSLSGLEDLSSPYHSLRSATLPNIILID